MNVRAAARAAFFAAFPDEALSAAFHARKLRLPIGEAAKGIAEGLRRDAFQLLGAPRAIAEAAKQP